jgi:hypothetical protein
VTHHGVESCGLDRGNVARNGSFCAPCGRTTALRTAAQGRLDPFAAPFGYDCYLRTADVSNRRIADLAGSVRERRRCDGKRSLILVGHRMVWSSGPAASPHSGPPGASQITLSKAWRRSWVATAIARDIAAGSSAGSSTRSP